MLHPIPPSNNVIVQISPAKDVQTNMYIKALQEEEEERQES